MVRKTKTRMVRVGAFAQRLIRIGRKLGGNTEGNALERGIARLAARAFVREDVLASGKEGVESKD